MDLQLVSARHILALIGSVWCRAWSVSFVEGSLMRAAQVVVGSCYVVKVSGVLSAVRIDRVSRFGVNVRTGREVQIKTAARLRYPAKADDAGQAMSGACLAGDPTAYVVRQGETVWVVPGESSEWVERRVAGL